MILDSHILFGLVATFTALCVLAFLYISGKIAWQHFTTPPRPRSDELYARRSLFSRLLDPQRRGVSGTLYSVRTGQEVDEGNGHGDSDIERGLPRYDRPPNYYSAVALPLPGTLDAIPEHVDRIHPLDGTQYDAATGGFGVGGASDAGSGGGAVRQEASGVGASRGVHGLASPTPAVAAESSLQDSATVRVRGERVGPEEVGDEEEQEGVDTRSMHASPAPQVLTKITVSALSSASSSTTLQSISSRSPSPSIPTNPTTISIMQKTTVPRTPTSTTYTNLSTTTTKDNQWISTPATPATPTFPRSRTDTEPGHTLAAQTSRDLVSPASPRI